MSFQKSKVVTATALALLAAPAAAQVTTFPDDVVINGDLTVDNGSVGSMYVEGDSVIDGSLCLGNTCSAGMGFANDETLIFRYTQHSIVFDDTSSSTSPDRDWTLRINDPNTVATGGIEKFAVEDVTAGTTPFTIEGGAPENALWIGATGNIGLGTSLPLTDLHVSGGNVATLRLEDTSANPGEWDVSVTGSAFWIADETNDTTPLAIEAGAPNSTLWLEDTGNVGIGTFTPDAPLEVSDDETFSFFRITATGAPVNQSVDITFTQGPLTTGELRYNIVDGDGPEMRLNADGDMDLDGTLTTAGSCSVGCDAVFDADYALPSIADHQARMRALGHLPNVGPTRDGEPWDVTDKLGRVLNELEHAHLYIGQLNERDTAQQARIAAQDARIEALSAQLAALTARLDAQRD